jgi:hypothetical protein
VSHPNLPAVGLIIRAHRKPQAGKVILAIKPVESLRSILHQCGSYYQSADLFHQRLWHERLTQIGFRVISVQKQSYHQLWDLRLYGSLKSELYLLATKPVVKRHLPARDLLLKQFEIEIRQIAQDLGAPIPRDSIQVERKGAYFRAILIWPPGKPGRWVKPEKKTEAFSFLIRPWLRRNRN